MVPLSSDGSCCKLSNSPERVTRWWFGDWTDSVDLYGDLIDTVTKLESSGIQLKSLNESIDTSSSSGKLIFHLFGALAEFERNLIKERTLAGLHAARARGRKGGRPPSLVSEKRKLVVKLYLERNYSVSQICQMMGISKPTLYKYVKASRTNA